MKSLTLLVSAVLVELASAVPSSIPYGPQIENEKAKIQDVWPIDYRFSPCHQTENEKVKMQDVWPLDYRFPSWPCRQTENEKGTLQDVLAAIIQKQQEKAISEAYAVAQVLTRKHHYLDLIKETAQEQETIKEDETQTIETILNNLMVQKQGLPPGINKEKLMVQKQGHPPGINKEKSTANEITTEQALLQLMKVLADDKAKE